MTNVSIRPIFGPAPTFGMSDVQKAQLAAEAARVARAQAGEAPPVAPEGSAKPSVPNLRANFMTMVRPTVRPTFGSTQQTSPNFLTHDIETGFESMSTEDLWKALVKSASEIPEVAKHFTFTDPAVVSDMMVALDVQKGDRVLEPSAGTGSMVFPAALASNSVEALEKFPMLQELLKRGAIAPNMDTLPKALVERIQAEQPRFTLLPNNDFLDMPIPTSDSQKYDKIILSPPFGGAEFDHIQKAYACLKPGGTMVAVLPGYDFTLSSTQLEDGSISDSSGKRRPFSDFSAFRDWFKTHSEQGCAAFIGPGGQPVSKNKSIRKRTPFVQYVPGEDGQVVAKQVDLNVVVVKITRPPVAIPLVLGQDKPIELPVAHDNNVVPLHPEQKLVVNG